MGGCQCKIHDRHSSSHSSAHSSCISWIAANVDLIGYGFNSKTPHQSKTDHTSPLRRHCVLSLVAPDLALPRVSNLSDVNVNSKQWVEPNNIVKVRHSATDLTPSTPSHTHKSQHHPHPTSHTHTQHSLWLNDVSCVTHQCGSPHD